MAFYAVHLFFKCMHNLDAMIKMQIVTLLGSRVFLEGAGAVRKNFSKPEQELESLNLFRGSW